MKTENPEPVRKAYSRTEAQAFAIAYLKNLYGSPKDMSDEAQDRYYTRLGLILGMFSEMFPES